MINLVKSQKSKIVSLLSGNPSKNLKIIGVTGTRGKTITANLLYKILLNSGIKVGLITTQGYSIASLEVFKDITANTLDVKSLNRILKTMASAGLTHVIIEVNSSALKNKVFNGIIFDSGIITNIFLDRPEVYETWENYAKTKLDFLNQVKDQGLVVVTNHNPQIANWLVTESSKIKNNIYSYWVDGSIFKDIVFSKEQMSFKVESQEYKLPLIGTGNLYNSLMAIKIAEIYIPNKSLSGILDANSYSISGRMEVVTTQPYMIVIDYAYTPQMMEDALNYLNLVKPVGSRIITVVGSSGSKNKERRLIAASACKFSNIVILAAEDPRSERVADINTELHLRAQEQRAILVERVGSQEEYTWLNKNNLKSKIERVINNQDVAFVAFDAEDYTSRLNAIDFAIKVANPNDIILIAGKGDDTTLSFANADYEWSDLEAVKQSLNANIKN